MAEAVTTENAPAVPSKWDNLTHDQKLDALIECESAIKQAAQAAYLVAGAALYDIREGDLYKERGYTNWGEYTEQNWGWKRDYADNLIKAALIVRELPEGTPVPATEAATRPLRALTAEKRAEVMNKAAELAEGEVINRNAIKKAIEESRASRNGDGEEGSDSGNGDQTGVTAEKYISQLGKFADRVAKVAEGIEEFRAKVDASVYNSTGPRTQVAERVNEVVNALLEASGVTYKKPSKTAAKTETADSAESAPAATKAAAPAKKAPARKTAAKAATA
ncbi:hypothetical protein [Nocardia sp. NPDC020380]|uniref:hypothetical protein n=1 Tax=Nocardia sp. NPDC020380 TaxID=3364309 RepID=UPI00378CC9A1